MKCTDCPGEALGYSPTPHGVGGLKFSMLRQSYRLAGSHPARGGWIEIRKKSWKQRKAPSHPARGGWIEIHRHRYPR